MRTMVLCERTDCVYHIVVENEGPAYRNQCGNDEIEIGINPDCDDVPVCFSYEKQEDTD